MRNLLIFILLLFGVWWVRRAIERHTQSKRRQAEDAHNTDAGVQARLTERVVACEHCGLHVPESEGVHAGEHFFCSDEHRRLGVRDASDDN